MGNQEIGIHCGQACRLQERGGRGEGVLARNGGNDISIRHAQIVNLNKELAKLESEFEPPSRQLQGFLALPPSKELAKVELARSREELEGLEKDIAGEVSSLHV